MSPQKPCPHATRISSLMPFIKSEAVSSRQKRQPVAGYSDFCVNRTGCSLFSSLPTAYRLLPTTLCPLTVCCCCLCCCPCCCSCSCSCHDDDRAGDARSSALLLVRS